MSRETLTNKGNKMINVKTADILVVINKGLEIVKASKAFQTMNKNPFGNSAKLAVAYSKYVSAKENEEKAGLIADMLDLIK